MRNIREHDVIIRLFGDFAVIHARTVYQNPDGLAGGGRYTMIGSSATEGGNASRHTSRAAEGRDGRKACGGHRQLDGSSADGTDPFLQSVDRSWLFRWHWKCGAGSALPAQPRADFADRWRRRWLGPGFSHMGQSHCRNEPHCECCEKIALHGDLLHRGLDEGRMRDRSARCLWTKPHGKKTGGVSASMQIVHLHEVISYLSTAIKTLPAVTSGIPLTNSRTLFLIQSAATSLEARASSALSKTLILISTSGPPSSK